MIKVMIHVHAMHDIITDHMLASFIPYTPNPIIKYLKRKTLICSKICQSDTIKLDLCKLNLLYAILKMFSKFYIISQTH